MAKLTEMGTPFSLLKWPERVAFMTTYRDQRQHDIETAAEFDLAKQAKSTRTREKKVREPKEKKPRAKKADTIKLNPEQLSLLKQLGMMQ